MTNDMTRMNVRLLAAVAVCASVTACFKDEPLGAECDIERAWIHYDRPEECVWNLSDTIVNEVYSAESKITFRVKPGTDRTRLAPQFVTTDRATLEPASGTILDFSHGALPYTVTSEDGAWQRRYEVAFVEEHHTTRDTVCYDFELFDLEETSKYYKWSELREDGTLIDNWASGNGGFAISNPSAKPDEYPTVPVEDGYEGYGVRLTTSKTGPIAALMNIPMAAGNLFVGKFNTGSALMKPLESTQFGEPFDKKPLKFTGYYKYRPGETFQDRYGNVMADSVDTGAIYAIFFKNHDADGNVVTLDGNNVQTSEYIVAKAIMAEVTPTEEWTAFEIPFDYSFHAFSQETLETFGYSLTVVFSSSKGGATFRGAIGSTLHIDKVRVICETEMTE